MLDQWPCWKVTRHGYLIADCYTPAELERVLEMHGIDLADLVEDDPDCELGKAESQEESRARA